MADDKKNMEYEYHFKCAEFELEFKGNEDYIRAMIQKYEPRVLTKLNQIAPVEKNQPAPHPQQHPAHPQHPQQKPQQPQQRPAEAQRYPDKHRGGRRGGQGYRKPMPQYPKPSNEPEQRRDPDEYLKDTPRKEEIIEAPQPPARVQISAGELKSLNERYLPQTSHDRVMIMIYHLEQSATDGFSSVDVQECYTKLDEKVPGNLSTVLNNATRSGFLTKEEKSGRIKYHLTFKGKRYVENGLRLD